MSDNDKEYSEPDANIIRYDPESRRSHFVGGDAPYLEEITAHVEKHIGEVETVYHEIVSDLIHLDILLVEPSQKRPYYTLVTSGMSDLPMNAPEERADFKYAELMICLPRDWPIQQNDFEDEKNYWPIRMLKILARFPHEYSTWLWASHTVPNGDPPENYARNTKFCCALTDYPVLAGPEFAILEKSDGQKIHFFSLIPIYKEEMEHKLKYGYDALVEKLDEGDVTMLLDIERKNMCKPSFFGLG